MMSSAALDQKLGTLMRMHEEASGSSAAYRRILYNRMRTVLRGNRRPRRDRVTSGVSRLRTLLGLPPRLCRPSRAQAKDKVESGVKYVRRNFDCSLLGNEPGNLDEFLCRMRAWVWEVANRRVHGTTHGL
jgi:transposase